MSTIKILYSSNIFKVSNNPITFRELFELLVVIQHNIQTCHFASQNQWKKYIAQEREQIHARLNSELKDGSLLFLPMGKCIRDAHGRMKCKLNIDCWVMLNLRSGNISMWKRCYRITKDESNFISPSTKFALFCWLLYSVSPLKNHMLLISA